MMGAGFLSILLLLINVGVSYYGFKNKSFFYQYRFDVEKVLVYKQYVRLVSSGFLHANWMHLIFNMLCLYSFSSVTAGGVGIFGYLLIYFGSLVGGNLLALLIHRNNSSYSSIGASGAVNGLIFAGIAMFPGLKLGLLFLPVSLPAWLFGLLFIAVSIYAVKSQSDNIGHEAHLGGGLTGILVAVALKPAIVASNYVTILIILVPLCAFLYVVAYKPELLLINSVFRRKQKLNIDHRYNLSKQDEQRHIDQILEKIHKRGMDSLTPQERQRLKRYSEN